MAVSNTRMVPSTGNRAPYTGRNLLSGLLFGVGIAAFVDETVFHQLLHWHHFYDKSTLDVGLVSDGLFHAFGWFAAVGALFMLADLFRRHAVWWTRWSGGCPTSRPRCGIAKAAPGRCTALGSGSPECSPHLRPLSARSHARVTRASPPTCLATSC
jgi:hypothetical protein